MDISEIIGIVFLVIFMLYSAIKEKSLPPEDQTEEKRTIPFPNEERAREKSVNYLPDFESSENEILYNRLTEQMPKTADSPLEESSEDILPLHPTTPSKIRKMVSRLPRLKDLVIYQEILGRPKSLRSDDSNPLS